MPLTNRLARLERSAQGIAAAATRCRDREAPDLIRAILSDPQSYEIADRVLRMLPDDADRPPGWNVHAEMVARPELAEAFEALAARLQATGCEAATAPKP
ncbi:MAG: hypothetical protein KF768_13835 [Phycisphaeraceae bacterium]|nr:hypothetical protein [Phycisphaeraceae bacterium]